MPTFDRICTATSPALCETTNIPRVFLILFSDNSGDLYFSLHAAQTSISLVHRHLSEAALLLGAGQADTAQYEIDKITHRIGGCV